MRGVISPGPQEHRLHLLCMPEFRTPFTIVDSFIVINAILCLSLFLFFEYYFMSCHISSL